jgi:hypothetical protein
MNQARRVPEFVQYFLLETPKQKVRIVGQSVEGLSKSVEGNDRRRSLQQGLAEDESEYRNAEIHLGQSEPYFAGRSFLLQEDLEQGGGVVLVSARQVRLSGIEAPLVDAASQPQDLGGGEGRVLDGGGINVAYGVQPKGGHAFFCFRPYRFILL